MLQIRENLEQTDLYLSQSTLLPCKWIEVYSNP